MDARPFGLLATLVAVIVGVAPVTGMATLVQSAEDADLRQATIACKVILGKITVTDLFSPNGERCDVTCQVISSLKGDPGKQIQVTFRRNGNGPVIPGTEPLEEGGVFLVMLNGTEQPYQVVSSLKALDGVVEHTLGTKPVDRLMSELIAMAKSSDKSLRIAAIGQIGIIRDRRGLAVVNDAAADKDPATARAGVIGLYRLQVAPDARRVMVLFDPEVMDVWYQESGTPQKDVEGKSIWRDEGNLKILERGLPDFDYATYVREGVKYDWVRKDEHSLYVFFGIAWKVQRRACVPELIKLLDHSDQNVRRWAVICLTHTIENRDNYNELKEFGPHEDAELAKWRSWWKKNEPAFRTESK